eukprot:m51a1_g9522 hypothetical protein (631) ;mRNA; r:757135-759722
MDAPAQQTQAVEDCLCAFCHAPLHTEQTLTAACSHVFHYRCLLSAGSASPQSSAAGSSPLLLVERPAASASPVGPAHSPRRRSPSWTAVQCARAGRGGGRRRNSSPTVPSAPAGAGAAGWASMGSLSPLALAVAGASLPATPPRTPPAPTSAHPGHPGHRSIAVALATSAPEMVFSQGGSVIGMITIEGLPPPPESPGRMSCCSDIVVAVDRSWAAARSAPCWQTASVQAVLLVASHLGPRDRLGVVLFDSTARTAFPLQPVDDLRRAHLRELLSAPIQQETAGQGTALWNALLCASSVFTPREQRPACACTSSVFVLSASPDTLRKGADIAALARAHIRGVLPQWCSLNTFGYGASHDAHLLSSLSSLCGGMYTPVDAGGDLGEAVASVLGGVLTVAAQGIEVAVAPVPPCQLQAVRSFPAAVYAQGPQPSARVCIPDLLEGERKCILVTLSEMAAVQVTVAGPMQGPPSASGGALAIERPAEQRVAEGPPSEELAEQLLRCEFVASVKAVLQFLAAGEAEAARSVLSRQINSVTASPLLLRPLCVAVIGDLRAMWERVGAEDVSALLISCTMQHAQQRSTASGLHASRLYMTPRRADYVALCTTLGRARAISSTLPPLPPPPSQQPLP